VGSARGQFSRWWNSYPPKGYHRGVVSEPPGFVVSCRDGACPVSDCPRIVVRTSFGKGTTSVVPQSRSLFSRSGNASRTVFGSRSPSHTLISDALHWITCPDF
jgi:hypothetical protein